MHGLEYSMRRWTIGKRWRSDSLEFPVSDLGTSFLPFLAPRIISSSVDSSPCTDPQTYVYCIAFSNENWNCVRPSY